MSPLSRARKMPVRRAKLSDSDTGAQMIKGYIRPLQSAELTASPPGDAMLHGTSNRHFIYTYIQPVRRTAYFHTKISN